MIIRLRTLLPICVVFLAGYAAETAYAFSGSNTKGDEEAGAVLFRDKGCAYCHGPNGAGGRKGPDLSGIRNDKAWTPAKMTDQILNGGQKMPPFSDSVTDKECAELVSYLRAKHRPLPPPAAAATPAPASN